jgi:hypothetical protein
MRTDFVGRDMDAADTSKWAGLGFAAKLVVVTAGIFAFMAALTQPWGFYFLVFGALVIASHVLWYTGSSLRSVGRWLLLAAIVATGMSYTAFLRRVGVGSEAEATAYFWIAFLSANATIILLPMGPPNFGEGWARTSKAVVVALYALILVPPLSAAGVWFLVIASVTLGGAYP